MTAVQTGADRQELVDCALNRLSEIDFAGVRMKLANSAEVKGWDDTMLDLMQREYCRFLALSYAYPDRIIVPDKAVDAFWHQHILDTRAYANDSVAVFGHFLHHFPYLGTRGRADKEKLRESYLETGELYELHFGPRCGNERVTFAEPSDCSDCSACTCSSGVS